MSLGQVRNKINIVDDNMKQLFDERMKCSNQVAAIKISEGDKVYKPLREKEIAERFSDDKEYLSFIKKVMQISRKRQYGLFLDSKNLELDKMNKIKELILKTGEFELELNADETSINGLNTKDILSILSDTSLSIKSLSANGCTVKVRFIVDNHDKAIREAMILTYMLSEETL